MNVFAAARILAFSIRTTTTTTTTTSPAHVVPFLSFRHFHSRSTMPISASAAYSAAARLEHQQEQQQQTNVLNNVTNGFPTPVEAAAASTFVADTGSSGSKDSGRTSTESYSPTALSRWSLLNHKLPAAVAIQSIHIYDFDNTCEALFFFLFSLRTCAFQRIVW